MLSSFSNIRAERVLFSLKPKEDKQKDFRYGKNSVDVITTVLNGSLYDSAFVLMGAAADISVHLFSTLYEWYRQRTLWFHTIDVFQRIGNKPNLDCLSKLSRLTNDSDWLHNALERMIKEMRQDSDHSSHLVFCSRAERHQQLTQDLFDLARAVIQTGGWISIAIKSNCYEFLQWVSKDIFLIHYVYPTSKSALLLHEALAVEKPSYPVVYELLKFKHLDVNAQSESGDVKVATPPVLIALLKLALQCSKNQIQLDLVLITEALIIHPDVRLDLKNLVGISAIHYLLYSDVPIKEDIAKKLFALADKHNKISPQYAFELLQEAINRNDERAFKIILPFLKFQENPQLLSELCFSACRDNRRNISETLLELPELTLQNNWKNYCNSEFKGGEPNGDIFHRMLAHPGTEMKCFLDKKTFYNTILPQDKKMGLTLKSRRSLAKAELTLKANNFRKAEHYLKKAHKRDPKMLEHYLASFSKFPDRNPYNQEQFTFLQNYSRILFSSTHTSSFAAFFGCATSIDSVNFSTTTLRREPR